MAEEKIQLALTVGDPAGIGPEITASLLAPRRALGGELYVIGSFHDLEAWLSLPICKTAHPVSWREADSLAYPDSFPLFIDTGEGTPVPRGGPSAAGGRAAGLAVETAVKLARRGLVEGLVTGPVSKEALALAGYRYTGHTEMLADLFGAPDCQMMMVAGELRIVILTRHLPLGRVAGAITRQRIATGVRVTAAALSELWSIDRPRIAVAALNPHRGESGMIGSEERDTIEPAIAELRRDGFLVDGPFPADTLFYKWEEKGYHAYIALYHDQGMIPFKLIGFDGGVNMTIGLPVVRTSVCHGTAYDIAGSGTAGTGSLEAALSLALQCCRAKRRGREQAKKG
jgi:4-hydroxythreonine-4-phosphate dehydrogenase